MQQIKQSKNPWIRLRLWLEARPALSLALCLAACLCSAPVFQILVEYVRMQQEIGALRYALAHLPALLAGSVALALFQLALLFFTRRPAVAVGVEGVAALLFAVANYFKLLYRETPLLPTDLAVADEGLAVGKELNLTPTREMIAFGVLLVVAVALLTRLRLPLPAGRRRLAVRLGGGAASLALLAAYLPLALWSPARMNPLGVEVYAENLAGSYGNGTAVTTFLYLTGNSTQHPPEGYDKETVEALAEQVAAAYADDGARPDILVVMAESFFDLQEVIPAEYSVDLTENFDRLAAEGVSGYFLSEGYSGGTANVEFAALTGYYTGYLPYGMTAYSGCVGRNFACYPRWLAEQGYTTAALHLNTANFYDRDKAYPNMGFETFWAIDDCLEPPERMGAYFDGFASDASTVEELIARYEQLSAGDEPVFLHTVTIQNHLPYMRWSYGDDYRMKADCPGLTEEERLILETVATNLRDTDQALGMLTDYLETVDREVILLFFGDHQTAVYGYNGEDVNNKAASYLSLEEPAQTVEKYKTPFLIWSNRRKQEAVQEPLATAEMLLPIASRWYDLPLSPWMSWLAGQLESCRGMARGYAIGPDGEALDPASLQTTFVKDHEMLQYDLLFGKEWSREALYGD